MLILMVQHGLCNRLRSIQGAVNFAQKYKMKVVVLWILNDACNCRYDDLFEKSGLFRVVHLRAKQKGIGVALRKLCNPQFMLYFGDTDTMIDDKLDRYLQKNGFDPQKHRLFISTYHAIYRASGTTYEWLVPKKAVTNRVNEIMKNTAGKRLVGVHFRGTDNVRSLQNSPRYLFFEAAQKELEQNENTVFFLATDEEDFKSEFCRRFGAYTVTNEGAPLSRTSKKGMMAGAVDLFCLAKTEKILQSYWSSFSDTAAEIGNIELQTLTEEKHRQ